MHQYCNYAQTTRFLTLTGDAISKAKMKQLQRNRMTTISLYWCYLVAEPKVKVFNTHRA